MRFTRLGAAFGFAFAAAVAATGMFHDADGIAILRPPADVSPGAWSADRMRDSRDRLKDILPGGPA